MTNPFAVILLQAFETYHNFKPNLPTTSAHHQTIPKALLYTVGTTVLAAAIYKTFNRSTSHNFLTIFLRPFQYLLNNKRDITTAELTASAIPFEEKYFKEYDEWVAKQPSSINDDNYVIVPALTTHKKECLENLYNTTIRETIDDFYADVIMYYDHATFSFVYYARTANIPYKYLETISRKYMIETNAPREIHIDIRDEFKKAKERTVAVRSDANSATDVSPTPTANDDANVFVKLKSYNTVSNLNIHTTTNDTKEKSHKFVTPNASVSGTTSEANPATTNKIIREKANRYSYRGKIHEFEETRKRIATVANTPATSDAATEEVIDYAEFKKHMIKTRSAL